MSKNIKNPNKKMNRNSSTDQTEVYAQSSEVLNLQEIGTESEPDAQIPTKPLNARGISSRLRKRNRLYLDDYVSNDSKSLKLSFSPKEKHISLDDDYESNGTKSIKLSFSPKDNAINASNETIMKVFNKRKSAPLRYMRLFEELYKPNEIDAILNNSPTTSTGFNTKTLKPDLKMNTSIGLRLRNFLKIHKSHKWIIYEWFYSYLDKPLFEGNNDFQKRLAETYPRLLSRNLTIAEWQKVRSSFGKPRRFSQCFIKKERDELELKRQKIRFLQLCKSGDIKDMQFILDLPERIPLPLPIGTVVSAILRKPENGIFRGKVAAFNSMAATYRIMFDRHDLGTHTVPDYEIAAENFFEMISLQSVTKYFRPHFVQKSSTGVENCITSCKVVGDHASKVSKMNLNIKDSLKTVENKQNSTQENISNNKYINGHPVDLLQAIVRLKKELSIKRAKLEELNSMNNEAENIISEQLSNNCEVNTLSDDIQSLSEPEVTLELSKAFTDRYIGITVSLHKLNYNIMNDIIKIDNFFGKSRDQEVQVETESDTLSTKCRESVQKAVDRINNGTIEKQKILSLIENLSTTLLVESYYKNNTKSDDVCRALHNCIGKIRSSISEFNIDTFQENILKNLELLHLFTTHGDTGEAFN